MRHLTEEESQRLRNCPPEKYQALLGELQLSPQNNRKQRRAAAKKARKSHSKARR